jgi:hypothetical protein
MLPRWVTWVFLGFLGYLLFLGSQATQHSAPVPNATIPPITEKTFPVLAKTTDMEHWKRAIDPDYAKQFNCVLPPMAAGGLGLQTIDHALGEGDPARCSDAVVVQLAVWGASKKIYDEKVDITLGTHIIAAGLDAGLVGMRIGGSRTLILPAEAVTRLNGKAKPPTLLLTALPLNKMAVVTATRVK